MKLFKTNDSDIRVSVINAVSQVKRAAPYGAVAPSWYFEIYVGNNMWMMLVQYDREDVAISKRAELVDAMKGIDT